MTRIRYEARWRKQKTTKGTNTLYMCVEEEEDKGRNRFFPRQQKVRGRCATRKRVQAFFVREPLLPGWGGAARPGDTLSTGNEANMRVCGAAGRRSAGAWRARAALTPSACGARSRRSW